LTRPDPDLLLQRLSEQESQARRGRLKVFLGAAPGVGKTYTMLEMARAVRGQGLDVVVGVVETHGRAETAALIEGLEVLPRRQQEHRGTTLSEFDLDAALVRRPALLVVDELAHTNAPGSRHAKRWQDIEELLSAGINVYSTLNVQHLESLNDVVAQITGIRVRETVPDSVLERASEVEMVDLPPDELLQRLREGKVYLPEAASRALDRFFRKGNLIALRELALRRTAERVDAQMRGYMAEQGIRETWPAGERVLVCVGSGPEAARVVRAGKRIAERLGAQWSVVHVEPPGGRPRLAGVAAGGADSLSQTLSLAEQLSAQVVVLSGQEPVPEILAYARSHNVTRLIVGKPSPRPWWAPFRRSMVDGLVRGSEGVDIQVVTGEPEPAPGRAARMPRAAAPVHWRQYLAAALVPVLLTVGALPLRGTIGRTIDYAMLFLLGVVFVAARSPRGPSVVASVLSVALFDWFFVPPYNTFAVTDVQYILTFGVMLLVALVMGNLTRLVRGQAEAARERERRTAMLYAFSRDLAAARLRPDLARVTLQRLHALFGGGVTLLLPDEHGLLTRIAWLPEEESSEKGLSVARWVFERGQPAGLGTSTLPASEALYVPLQTPGRRLGVIGIRPEPPDRFGDPGQRRLLESMVDQAAVALERSDLADAARRAHIDAEAERLRTSLLTSLSHDMRTPLGAIQGAASALLSEGPNALRDSAQRELAETVLEESRRMDRLVANLLDMIRLETGALGVQREWQVLEDIVGVALIRLQQRLREHPVTTRIPPDLPLVPVDEVLLEQVFVNLLENAAKHTPAGTPIEIGARALEGEVEVWVADRGPGLPVGEEERVFEKFRRGGSGAAGVGLGLTIVRGILRAHGGRIFAAQRPGGGAVFTFFLPLVGKPAAIPAEPAETADSNQPAE
jgi:two-component system sensor histidine kinase KdpD